MKPHVVLALAAAAAFAAQAAAGERFKGAWWTGVRYSQGRFEPGERLSGRPPLVEHADWRLEETKRGTLVRVGKGYLTADEKGVVSVSTKAAPGSYWDVKEVKSEKGYYDKPKEDWKGSWSRTSYTLEPLAKGLKGGKLGFRDGKLTVHPKNKALAILSETLIDAKEISGK
jgi:hypothetical protein